MTTHTSVYIFYFLQGPRAQIDRVLYKHHMQNQILSMPNLTVKQAPVEDLILNDVPPGHHPALMKTCHGVILGRNCYH